MPITYDQCVTLAAGSIGLASAELEAGIADASRIVNDAGRAMFTMNDWYFTRGAIAEIDGTADDTTLALPADLGQLVQLYSNADKARLYPVALADVHRLQAEFPNRTSLGPSHVAFEYVAGVPRLAIWPTLSDDADGLLTLTYDRGWADIASNDTIPIPWYAELLFVEVAKAVAGAYYQRAIGELSERLMLIRRGPVYMAAERADVERSVDQTPLPLGLAARPRYVGGSIDTVTLE